MALSHEMVIRLIEKKIKFGLVFAIYHSIYQVDGNGNGKVCI